MSESGEMARRVRALRVSAGRRGEAVLDAAARHPRVWVGTLTLLALLLRAWEIDRMSIWQDEGLTLYRAGLDLPGILSGQIPLDALLTRDVQPPL